MTQGWSVNVAEVSLSRQANRAGTGWASVIVVFAGGHTWAARMGHTGTEAKRWTSGTQLVCQVAVIFSSRFVEEMGTSLLPLLTLVDSFIGMRTLFESFQ